MDTVEFSRTVPRELVHRLSVAEVLVTGAVARDEDTLDVGTQIPRSHAFYRDTAGCRHLYDPMVLVEAARQTLIMLGHELFDMPFGTKFILREIALRDADPTALAVCGVPTEVVLRCHILRRFRGRAGVSGARLRYTALVGDRVAATLECSMSWVPPDRWQAMRDEGRTELGLAPGLVIDAPEPPPRVGELLVDRRDPANVVLSSFRVPPGDRTTGTARLVVDTGHPVLFDHVVDHVPGMLTLEAFRQLGIATAVATGALPSASALLTGVNARFTGIGELDLPISCESVLTRTDGTNAVLRCALRQEGRTVAEGEVCLTAVAEGEKRPAGTGVGEVHLTGIGAGAEAGTR
ncbi:ScbA/BarX family gamma-butyrolactone biosynthesis protein [Streptantibioticus silvisoli]|uniref:ScbA/BarX family gamma-butyrolactone biosynthesis protein n=1 Tax=Streptantibioticus silvisoli TaxID=2705255 RepID=A0ABT6VVK5_9ACTN|nr:ScbA/BarX family gamma-butyrolactone biosynthesis protein [Streptantibioticus silvisoli]MDI5961311.1 ScbA/BarX family gamma-butyrolactone biosynthesis protein [Streptantibioticus silvisoli]